MIERIERWYVWADHSDSAWAFWPWLVLGIMLCVLDGVPQSDDQ